MNVTLTAIDHLFAHPMYKILAVAILAYIFCYLPLSRMESFPRYGNKGKMRFQWVFFFTDNFGVIISPPEDRNRCP